jgi:hypothetical protein
MNNSEVVAGENTDDIVRLAGVILQPDPSDLGPMQIIADREVMRGQMPVTGAAVDFFDRWISQDQPGPAARFRKPAAICYLRPRPRRLYPSLMGSVQLLPFFC